VSACWNARHPVLIPGSLCCHQSLLSLQSIHCSWSDLFKNANLIKSVLVYSKL
jgi:hypothetical protein